MEKTYLIYPMRKTIQISGISLILSSPDDIPDIQWIGEELYQSQLLAAWTIVDPKHDIPMNPQILGKPGVGKTTLAYSTARQLELPVYIFQCTVDTRPEDLLITPVIGKNHTIEYHASPLVSAMIEGGVCILDEANRMAEKSWASLAPLLDQRRYVESIIAGIKIPAHPNFRICVTMNEDSSTFEVPEYIHSRLQPQIFIEFPDPEEEFQILKFNLPFASDQIIEYTVRFLQKAHKLNKNYTVRDGINICRYYLKIQHHFFEKSDSRTDFQKKEQGIEQKSNQGSNKNTDRVNKKLFQQALFHILGEDGYRFYLGKNQNKEDHASQFQDIFDQLNSIFYEDSLDEDFEEESYSEESDKEGDFVEFDEEDESFLEDIDGDDIDLLDLMDESEEKWYERKKEEDVIEPILDEDEKSEAKNSKNFKDPNEIIREFLERKNREKFKKHFGQKSDQKSVQKSVQKSENKKDSKRKDKPSSEANPNDSL